jgi:hypothetical protein
MTSVRQQFRNNTVALISLVIAVGSLGYNTWRNETTEKQRNVRHAAFRVLESLGELQEIVDTRYYYLPFEKAAHREGETRVRGFGTVTMVRDLMSLMPAPGPRTGEELHELWLAHFVELHRLDGQGAHTPEASQAERLLTEAIGETREAILVILAGLE